MSEFYFDCKCIASNGSDKTPEFFLYQDYDTDRGGMCAQIYIPKKMQSGFCAVRLCFVPDGVDFTGMTDTAPEIYTIGAVAADPKYKSISETNSIFLAPQGGRLSGCGVMEFIDGTDVTAPAKKENTYKFVINYTKKQTISYSIDENKTGFTLRILYPLIRTPIDVAILKKKSAKPVLIADRLGADKYLLNKAGTRVIVTLKPTGRPDNSTTIELDAADTDGSDFRLVFVNGENNKHYLLVDESEYTVEDKKRRKRVLSFKRKLEKTAKRCPFCNGPLVVYGGYKHGTTRIVTCDGKLVASDASDKELKGKLTVVCKHDVIRYAEGCKTEADPDISLPLKARPIVPEAAFDLPSLNIVTAGFPNSGKSVYLASLMNMKISGGKVVSDPFVLSRITAAFGGGKNAVEEIKFDAVSVNGKGKASYSPSAENRRASTIPLDGKVKLRYVMSVGGGVEANTPPGDATRLAYNPIGYRMGKLGCVYFYDVPGELYKTPTGALRSAEIADCYIAVIDGDPALGNKALDNTLSSLENLKKLAPSKNVKDMPIALVFTKHDKKLTDYISPTDQKDYDACFDENCHVVREDMIELIGGKHAYEGSNIERHIECSSYELEHYLKAQNPAAFETMISEYSNIKFFTCSALGNDFCLADPTGGTKEVLFRPRRIRVELPLIWLMYGKGLIKR